MMPSRQISALFQSATSGGAAMAERSLKLAAAPAPLQNRDITTGTLQTIETPLPVSDQRQHQRSISATARISPISSVGIDGGGKADALREPGAHRRRHVTCMTADAGPMAMVVA